MSNARSFRYFKTSPEIIRLAVMMYVRYPLFSAWALTPRRGRALSKPTLVCLTAPRRAQASMSLNPGKLSPGWPRNA
jgi:hypothetical protein